jgi:hypothetical protein
MSEKNITGEILLKYIKLKNKKNKILLGGGWHSANKN